MIPKLFKSGKSFRGLIRYLSTDPKAQTSERVDWTHTLNLAYDHVPSAVDEMLWTYRSADWLKRQAGVPTGGSPLKDPVRHFSLNWHASETPTREHMIETVEHFMKHMKWHEHQAIIFCHTDKHPHVHVVVNAVHPETGRTLDSRFDRSRAQRWALGYEKEHEMLCTQRLLPEKERKRAPTREAWMKMKDAERQLDEGEANHNLHVADYIERGGEAGWKAKEWEMLREHQKDQRLAFFAEGKQEFKERRDEVFREVREAYRPEWRAYYRSKREGADKDRLAEMRADILGRQNAELEQRRDDACGSLREHRDSEYKLLKIGQQQQRAELKGRQQRGLRSGGLFDRIYDPDEILHAQRAAFAEETRAEEARYTEPFREAGRETCEPAKDAPAKDVPETEGRREPEFDEEPASERHKVRDPLDAAGVLGLGALGAIADVGERLLDGFLGGPPRRQPRQKEDRMLPKDDSRQPRPAEDRQRADATQAEEARRLEEYWKERRRSRGHRDRD